MATRTSKSKWQQKREASHEALIRSAIHRFHEHGYAATRVEDIVADTPYTKGAFYFHFANKLDCFWQAIAYREQVRRDWQAAPAGDSPEPLTLEAAVRGANETFTRTLEGLNVWVLVMVDAYQQHREDPDTLKQLHEIYARWHDEITSFVAALQEAGLARTDKPAAQLAQQIFAYGEGLATHAQIYGLDSDTFEDTLYDGLLALLETAETRRQRGAAKR